MASKKSTPAEKRAVLVLVSGTSPQETIKLRRDATIFGREKGDILIEDKEISSTHCQIQNINNVYHVFDMNSTNGTFVNNERVVKAKLKDGDVVTIGTTSFRFSMEDEDRVRHIHTIFRSMHPTDSKTAVSLVDTLIEGEMRSTQAYAIRMRIEYGDGTREDLELKQRNVYLGRASSFGKFDQDEEISRKHLLVKVNDQGQVFIEDQGSTNGSFLNENKITGMHLVGPSDNVRIGATRLRITARHL